MLLKYIKLRKAKTHFKLHAVPTNFIVHTTSNNHLVDANNCILINLMYHSAILNSAEFAQLKFGNLTRLVQVVPTEALELNSNEILVSYTLKHNLRNIGCDDTMKTCQVLPVNINNIKTAAEVHLAGVTCQQVLANSVTDIILKSYFRNPKLVYKNDLIPISLKQHAAEFHYTNLTCNEVDEMYFKCQQISIEGVSDCIDGYFCVVGGTTLTLAAEIQSSLPKAVNIMRQNLCDSKHDQLVINSCPYGLETYLNKLEIASKPFLNNVKLKLNPMFLITGPKGSGKAQILSSLSQKLGMKMCRVSNVDLSAQAYAQTEIKIKNAMFRAKVCAPCMLVINNFEEFCKNNEGQHDPRIINHFKTELDLLFSSTEQPIILICVSNSKELPSDLGRMFLETIKINAPSQEERELLLSWILANESLTSDYVKDIAAKTHGFLFEDLKALVHFANGRQVVTANDFESALDIMQNSYTESLGAPKVPKVQWSDVGGLEDVKQEIIKTINLPLKHPELLKTGLKRSGILLYGPPGTGKTLMAKAVATECGLCFLSVKGPELLNMYVGQSEQNVREVFEKARSAAPCIIFFDELDSLAPNRGISGDSGGVMDRVVSQLLSEMDGLNQNATIFVIGATNRPDLIDPALLRPGRFDKLLYVGPCTDASAKLGVLRALTRKFKFSDKLSLEKVVKTCPANITGADFYGICSSAWMSAASRLIRKIEKGKLTGSENLTQNDVIVTFKDFDDAIKSTKPSVNASDMAYFEKLRHELSTK